jgi:hypothetical protein
MPLILPVRMDIIHDNLSALFSCAIVVEARSCQYQIKRRMLGKLKVDNLGMVTNRLQTPR